MPAITRLGVDPSAGHCFPARPTDSSNTSVYINKILANTVTDHYPLHCCGTPCHDGNASQGSTTVFIEKKAVHRIGDDISCGDVSANGSPNVFCGG